MDNTNKSLIDTAEWMSEDKGYSIGTEEEYNKFVQNRCRCDKDHSNDVPIDPNVIANDLADDIARDIDNQVFERIRDATTKIT